MSFILFIKRLSYYAKIELFNEFPGSKDYWDSRYGLGGTSGAGSNNELAELKASVINRLVEKENVNSVIDFGCGDGNQLNMAKYPSYIGFDISKKAVERCIGIFTN